MKSVINTAVVVFARRELELGYYRIIIGIVMLSLLILLCNLDIAYTTAGATMALLSTTYQLTAKLVIDMRVLAVLYVWYTIGYSTVAYIF